MRRIEPRELPNIDDPLVRELGLCVQAIRHAALAVVPALLAQHDGVKRAEPIIVGVSVLNRMTECSLSIELLVSKGRLRDAGTLILTLMELRLDVQYMAQEAGRDTIWLKHAMRHRKPWKVAKQIDALHPPGTEREAEKENYRHFSLSKHANPAGGTVGFPLSPFDDGLRLCDPDENRNLLPAYLFAVSTNLAEAVAAIASMATEAGFDVTGPAERVKQAHRECAELHDAHVEGLARRLMRSRRVPDRGESDG